MLALLLAGCDELFAEPCVGFESTYTDGVAFTMFDDTASVVGVKVIDRGTDFRPAYLDYDISNLSDHQDCVVAVYLSETEPDLSAILPLDPVENIPADRVVGLGELVQAANLPPNTSWDDAMTGRSLRLMGEADRRQRFVTVVTCGDAPIDVWMSVYAEWAVQEDGGDCDGAGEEIVVTGP